mmetsp:Transcript_67547/g.186523  ORF Transcript_67547/g.186523 Transcript_67547/m.186523 type:complete len:299 (-) Transcript_67547:1939-2835(-)
MCTQAGDFVLGEDEDEDKGKGDDDEASVSDLSNSNSMSLGQSQSQSHSGTSSSNSNGSNSRSESKPSAGRNTTDPGPAAVTALLMSAKSFHVLWECQADIGWQEFGNDVNGDSITEMLEASFRDKLPVTFEARFKQKGRFGQPTKTLVQRYTIDWDTYEQVNDVANTRRSIRRGGDSGRALTSVGKVANEPDLHHIVSSGVIWECKADSGWQPMSKDIHGESISAKLEVKDSISFRHIRCLHVYIGGEMVKGGLSEIIKLEANQKLAVPPPRHPPLTTPPLPLTLGLVPRSFTCRISN